MSDKNDDIQKMHRDLIALNNRLLEKMNVAGDAGDVAASQAIYREMLEVSHRVTIAGQLLFKAKSEAITAACGKVDEAIKDVNAAIKTIDDINAFIATISGFLGLVDTVLDLAKPL